MTSDDDDAGFVEGDKEADDDVLVVVVVAVDGDDLSCEYYVDHGARILHPDTVVVVVVADALVVVVVDVGIETAFVVVVGFQGIATSNPNWHPHFALPKHSLQSDSFVHPHSPQPRPSFHQLQSHQQSRFHRVKRPSNQQHYPSH